jgi:hypothetical protein
MIYVSTQISGSGCKTAGIGASDGGDFLFPAGTKIFGCSNDNYGIRSLSSTIRANGGGVATAQGNTGHGISADTNGLVEVGAGTISQTNGGCGFYATSGRIVCNGAVQAKTNGQGYHRFLRTAAIPFSGQSRKSTDGRVVLEGGNGKNDLVCRAVMLIEVSVHSKVGTTTWKREMRLALPPNKGGGALCFSRALRPSCSRAWASPGLHLRRKSRGCR